MAEAVINKQDKGPILMVSSSETLEVLTIQVHSHLANIAKPGTYSQEANKLLKLNGMKTQLILPDNPPSEDIFKLRLTPTTETNEMETEQTT